MKQHLTKKIVLSTSILLMGLTSMASVEQTPLSNTVEAKWIDEYEFNIPKIKAYYQQDPIHFTNKYLYFRKVFENIKIFAISTNYGPFVKWTTSISSEGNDGNNLRQLLALEGHQVDVFGLKNNETIDDLFIWEEYVTGGVTKTPAPEDQSYDIKQNLTVNDTVYGEETFLRTRKPKITLKEVDFYLRKDLIRRGKLYTKDTTKGTIDIKDKDGKQIANLNLRYRLADNKSNYIIQDPKTVKIEVKYEEK